MRSGIPPFHKREPSAEASFWAKRMRVPPEMLFHDTMASPSRPGSMSASRLTGFNELASAPDEAQSNVPDGSTFCARTPAFEDQATRMLPSLATAQAAFKAP